MFNAFSFAKVAALLICIFLTSVRTSHGQLDCACFDRVQPGGIGAGDVFGHSAHINGDYAVIGAPGKGPGTKPGTAFVYKLEGENWVLQAQLLASDGNANDYFGASVTISGDLIAVGAILADPYGKNSGAVYVFRRFGSIWTEEAKLEPNPNSEEPVVSHDAFGNSVAISGSMVLVGTPGHNTNGPNTGSVLVFQPVLGLWSEVQRIEPANFQAGADFGYKITTSGTTAFISAYGHDSFSNTDNGIVFVYAFTGGTWIQTAQITGLINGARFGVDLDVDNNKLIVGTIGDGAYIFTPGVGGIWQESAHLVPPGPSSTALGHSVAISDDIDGTVAFVGDYAFDVLDTDPSCVAPTPEGQSRPDHLGAGAVYTFASCTGQWIHTNTDVSDVVSLNGLWGVSIAAENGRIVIGDWDFGNGLIGGASFGYIDRDGDGLPDLWEQTGIPYGVNSTYLLPDANVCHKDLFVEVDWMLGFAMSPSSRDMVIQAFADADQEYVRNPDMIGGIQLHLDLSTADSIPAVPWTAQSAWDDFDAVAIDLYGTISERNNSEFAALWAAKRRAYRYCILVESIENNVRSGKGEVIGDDFIVSLGSFFQATGGSQAVETASAFMHEFGHTLGLYHGGQDDILFKPNYKSVMNYTWTFPLSSYRTPNGIDETNFELSWELIYSSDPHNSSDVAPGIILDELALDEPSGIYPDSRYDYAYVPVGFSSVSPAIFAERIVHMSSPVDWNMNGTTQDIGVSADINNIFPNSDPSLGELLATSNDWENMRLKFCGGPSFNPGVHYGPESEISFELLSKMFKSCRPDYDDNGFVDVLDLLFLLAEWGQVASPAEINGDNIVNVEDQLILLALWGACP